MLELRAKAFDCLFDAVVVTDLNGIITDWNNGAEALYGYSKEEAIGELVSILHVPEDIDHITAEVLVALEEFGRWSGEVKMKHKDGSIGWIESICVPILDANDQTIGALGINRDISARIIESERLAHLAHYDYLTNIPNRFLVLDRVEHLIATSQRNHSRFALVFIDLNKFKTINDTKGHSFGDKVLIETALRLKKSIRNSDTAARIGGDEFLVLLESVHDKNNVATKVDVLSKALAEKFIIEGEVIEIGCSFGIAIYPDDGNTADALLKLADKAMYESKHINLST
jgi:diguanylate cyclase (GGDEF)-like protein/PAS domain S-box-containing protein